MAGSSGLFGKSLQIPDLSGAVWNLWKKQGTVAVVGAGGSTISGAPQLAPMTPQNRVVKFYKKGSGTPVTVAVALSFEYLLPDHTTIESVQLFPTTQNAFQYLPSHIVLRKAQYNFGSGPVEVGDVEIVGLSPANTPDYVITGSAQLVAGSVTSNAYSTFTPIIFYRSDGTFRAQRLPEKTAFNRRQFVAGTIILARHDATYGLAAVWADPNGGATPFSAVDTVTPSDATNIQAITGTIGTQPETEPSGYADNSSMNYDLPVLATNAASAAPTKIELTFAADQKVTWAMCKPWLYPSSDPGNHWFDAWTPACGMNISLGAAANKCLLRLSDFRTSRLSAAITTAGLTAILPPNAPGTYSAPITGNIYERDGVLDDLDILRISFAAFIEPAGDDAT